MPGRVRQFNLALATYFAAQLGSAAPVAIPEPPVISQVCAVCGSGIPV